VESLERAFSDSQAMPPTAAAKKAAAAAAAKALEKALAEEAEALSKISRDPDRWTVTTLKTYLDVVQRVAVAMGAEEGGSVYLNPGGKKFSAPITSYLHAKCLAICAGHVSHGADDEAPWVRDGPPAAYQQVRVLRPFFARQLSTCHCPVAQTLTGT